VIVLKRLYNFLLLNPFRFYNNVYLILSSRKYLKAASNAQQRIEPSLQGVAGDFQCANTREV
jgi:hypothetical protein